MGTEIVARTFHRLSALKVRTATIPEGRNRAMLGDGANLWLQLTRASDGGISRSWVLRYTRDGKQREMGLGPVHRVSLAEARELAEGHCKLLQQGLDPKRHRDEQRAQYRAQAAKALSFDQAIDRYLADTAPKWRSAKYRGQWVAGLRQHISPKIGQIEVKNIDRGDVMAALRPIWRAKPATAAKLRSRIEIVLDWANAHGLRDGENPARLGPIRHGLGNHAPARQHHPALPYARIPEFIAALRARKGIPYWCIEFVALTACRSSDARGATWAEVDFELKTWSIPGERMKMGRPHRVPLSRPAVAVLHTMSEISGGDPNALIFPGRDKRPMSDVTLTRGALSLLGFEDDEKRPITIHGLRSTFRDWAADHGFPGDVCEMALAHIVRNQVEAAYRRGDLFERRRTLMENWGAFCDAAPPAAANVIPITA